MTNPNHQNKHKLKIYTQERTQLINQKTQQQQTITTIIPITTTILLTHYPHNISLTLALITTIITTRISNHNLNQQINNWDQWIQTNQPQVTHTPNHLIPILNLTTITLYIIGIIQITLNQ